MQNKSHIALKARLAQCKSLEEVIKLSRKVTNPFLNPNLDDREKIVSGESAESELQKSKRPQPQRWPTETE